MQRDPFAKAEKLAAEAAVAERERIDAAIDASVKNGADPSIAVVCENCGAFPGNPCISHSMADRNPQFVHRVRRDTFQKQSAIQKVPSAQDVALRELRAAVKLQIVAFAEGEITAKSLSRLQRFCASMGQAMVGLEKPDALVRDRFGMKSLPVSNLYLNDDMDIVEDSLSPAPPFETYGANMSRGLIGEAVKMGKEIVEAQVAGQKEARKSSSLPELVTALALAKKQKLGKNVIDALEQQIAAASATVGGA